MFDDQPLSQNYMDIFCKKVLIFVVSFHWQSQTLTSEANIEIRVCAQWHPSNVSRVYSFCLFSFYVKMWKRQGSQWRMKNLLSAIWVYINEGDIVCFLWLFFDKWNAQSDTWQHTVLFYFFLFFLFIVFRRLSLFVKNKWWCF